MTKDKDTYRRVVVLCNRQGFTYRYRVSNEWEPRPLMKIDVGGETLLFRLHHYDGDTLHYGETTNYDPNYTPPTPVEPVGLPGVGAFQTIEIKHEPRRSRWSEFRDSCGWIVLGGSVLGGAIGGLIYLVLVRRLF